MVVGRKTNSAAESYKPYKIYLFVISLCATLVGFITNAYLSLSRNYQGFRMPYLLYHYNYPQVNMILLSCAAVAFKT